MSKGDGKVCAEADGTPSRTSRPARRTEPRAVRALPASVGPCPGDGISDQATPNGDPSEQPSLHRVRRVERRGARELHAWGRAATTCSRCSRVRSLCGFGGGDTMTSVAVGAQRTTAAREATRRETCSALRRRGGHRQRPEPERARTTRRRKRWAATDWNPASTTARQATTLCRHLRRSGLQRRRRRRTATLIRERSTAVSERCVRTVEDGGAPMATPVTTGRRRVNAVESSTAVREPIWFSLELGGRAPSTAMRSMTPPRQCAPGASSTAAAATIASASRGWTFDGGDGTDTSASSRESHDDRTSRSRAAVDALLASESGLPDPHVGRSELPAAAPRP